EILGRDCVLGIDPLLDLGGVQILHPAIRVGDLRTEVVVHDVAFSGLRIFQRRLRHERRVEQGENEDRASGSITEVHFASPFLFYFDWASWPTRLPSLPFD